MDEEMKKGLEEATAKYIKETIPDDIPCYDSVVETTKQDFTAGAEWMFKECGGMTVLKDMRRLILAQCKEWLKENGYLATNGWYTIKGTLADFEADMNKLWEGEK